MEIRKLEGIIEAILFTMGGSVELGRLAGHWKNRRSVSVRRLPPCRNDIGQKTGASIS